MRLIFILAMSAWSLRGWAIASAAPAPNDERKVLRCMPDKISEVESQKSEDRSQPCLRRRRIEQPVTSTVADCRASRAAVFRESADVENKRLDWKSQIRSRESE